MLCRFALMIGNSKNQTHSPKSNWSRILWGNKKTTCSRLTWEHRGYFFACCHDFFIQLPTSGSMYTTWWGYCHVIPCLSWPLSNRHPKSPVGSLGQSASGPGRPLWWGFGKGSAKKGCKDWWNGEGLPYKCVKYLSNLPRNSLAYHWCMQTMNNQSESNA